MISNLDVTSLEAADAELRDQVHPSAWTNPPSSGTYDLVVIGGGTAGLVSAIGAAGLGARVALIERHLLGGDCLNTGCVPSKAILRSARVVGELRRGGTLGVRAREFDIDFAAVMRRMRERRAFLARHDAAARVQRSGVELFFGEGRFADRRTIEVDGQRIRFNRAVITTGARPALPPIAGLDSVPVHTSETIFSLTERPRRLLVIGAGPIGCELAQAFARLGSEVTMFGRPNQVLPRESAPAAAFVRRSLESDNVRLALGVRLASIEARQGEILVHSAGNGHGNAAPMVTSGDLLLVAAGRAPNVEGLRLDLGGVACDARGVTVNDRLQTSNPRVFASGDVCSTYKFTHAADAMSRLVLQNALFFGRRKASALVIPWVTYTDPEVAHVGVSAAEVATSGGRFATVTVSLTDIDRAVVDDDAGVIEVHHERGRLRGCTIVAPHAGEIIGEVAYAIDHRGTLGDLSATVHPYPTVSEALRKAGDAYRRQALTPAVQRWLSRYFRWTR